MSNESVSKLNIEKKFVESGEKERLKELLCQRLNEAGWQNEIQQKCRQIIKDRGVDNITSEDLIAEVTPIARKKVPDSVKRELLQHIKTFLQVQSGIQDL